MMTYLRASLFCKCILLLVGLTFGKINIIWGAPTNSEFLVKVSSGVITSLQCTNDSFLTEYMAGRLGDVNIKYSPTPNSLLAAQTAALAAAGAGTYGWSQDGTKYMANYQLTNGQSAVLALESVFDFSDPTAVKWTLSLTNLTSNPVEIGDLALPLPMNGNYSGVSSSTMKHSYIEGNGSYIFWMRPNSVGPYLLMTPLDSTKFEFWDGNGSAGTYEVYIHSAVAGTNAVAQYPSVTSQGARWRQPNTSLTLGAGAYQSYGCKFQWVNNYDGIRQALVDDGKIDVHVVPGMTVPTNLFAEVALRTTQTVASVSAEFPSVTQILLLGTTNVGTTGPYRLYQIQFSQLGENELTIQYGNSQTTYLEFFVTEPIETLIKKRANYLIQHQITNSALWYNGLYCDFNMNDGQLITPDNHDTLSNSFQVYEIACDDAGESRPAYIGTKEAVFPVQSEVTSLDNYIKYFVWNSPASTGGLQRTTNETSAYGIYGVPDWNYLRGNNIVGLGRGYDYPHIFVMYYGMYQVAKCHPEINTYLSATQYLARAYGTAMALWANGGGQATEIGLMNELVIPDIINALQAEGMTNQAANLTTNWETKVRYYLDGNANLFASEYSFDATGFESQQAYAKYAMLHAGTDPMMGSTNLPAFLQEVTNFMNIQITANIFDRGWLETAYYYYGSDYRGSMGDDFVLTYMAQMGGSALLDYALNDAPSMTTNPADYLRLGYASILSAWATMNSGPTPNYGFWYPGAANDGGCGGGFQPEAYSTTWLNNQLSHRGPWYYSAEENLGFCGAIRAAATVLADDPIFGRFCYGGTWQQTTTNIQVIPLDGVRRRFHAMLNNGNCHLIIDTDRFADSQSIVLQPDLSSITFTLETGNINYHTAALHLTVSMGGAYTVNGPSGTVAALHLQPGAETIVELPIPAGTGIIPFTISTAPSTITATANTGGNIIPNGAVLVPFGSNQSFTITTNNNYMIANVLVDGITQEAINSYAFTNVTSSHTILATFLPVGSAYTLTASAGVGGIISPAGNVVVVSGSNQNFTVTPSYGYAVSNVIVDGVSLGPVSSFAFNDVTTNHVISAAFSNIVLNITASAGAGGVISPSGSVPVGYGSNQSFTITPNNNYAISNVVVDGISFSAISSYLFTNVITSHSIWASFGQIRMVSGKVTDTSGAPICGATVYFSLTPNAAANSLYTATAAASGLYTQLVGSATLYISAGASNWTTSADQKVAAVTNDVANVDFALSSLLLTGNVPKTNQLLFSMVADSLPSSGLLMSWPTYIPAGLPFVPISGFPLIQNIDGKNWDQNVYASGIGFRLENPSIPNNGQYTNPIPLGSGATIVLATIPQTNAIAVPWDSIVDIFFNQLSLGIRNDTGQICVGVNDNTGANNSTPNNFYNGPTVPSGQIIILSIVVSTSGKFMVYTNGIAVWTNTASLPNTHAYTQLTPGARTSGNVNSFSSYINIGREDPDSWSVYNGYIGDIFVYTNALSNSDRQQLENYCLAYYGTNKTITATAGTGGVLIPDGTVSVISGHSQSFVITNNAGYAITNVMVDGVSQGAISSYIFSNVTASHTISVALTALPPPMLLADNFRLSSGIPTFTVPNTLSGHQYTLVYKSSLTDPVWIPLTGLGATAGTGGNIYLSDTNAIGSQTQRFYRIQMQ